jgi:hypothetical protein
MKELINKNIISYFIALVIMVGFGYFKFVIPKIKTVIVNSVEINSLNSQIADLKAKTSMNQINASLDDLSVKIYKSPYQNLAIENASVDLVDTLIEKIKKTGNKVLEISFKNQDQGNNLTFLNPSALLPNQQNTNNMPKSITVSLTLNANYLSLKKLFTEISNWEYLAGIKYLSVHKSQDATDLLEAKLDVDLYIN